MTLTVSIVSHGHGSMLGPLVDQLLGFPEVTQIVLTYNIPEAPLTIADSRIVIVNNQRPKGFGANHNAALSLSTGKRFCVLNPDVSFDQNPFPILVKSLEMPKTALAVPRVVGATGETEDSLRAFLTPVSMLKRLTGFNPGTFSLNENAAPIYPDWAAGMFMLFNAEAYARIGGFDEAFFMYCEDADICTRMWAAGYRIIACPAVSIIHPGQRASHRSVRHIVWHVKSLLRYFIKHRQSISRISQNKPVD